MKKTSTPKTLKNLQAECRFDYSHMLQPTKRRAACSVGSASSFHYRADEQNATNMDHGSSAKVTVFEVSLPFQAERPSPGSRLFS